MGNVLDRAQLMLFPIFLVWGSYKLSESLGEIHWLECDRKEDQVQFCPGPNFSILWPPTTYQTSQNLLLKSECHFISFLWVSKGWFFLVQPQRAACFSLWSIKQISVPKFYTWDRGVQVLASLTVSKSEFCIFRPSPLCIERGKARVI